MPNRGTSSEYWDGRPRRKADFDDDGKITAAVIMARVDMRTERLEAAQVDFKKQFSNHLDDDKTCFGFLRKDIADLDKSNSRYMGGLGVLMFLLTLASTLIVVFMHH